jgi:peptide subunit release factor 1 (eRF1)
VTRKEFLPVLLIVIDANEASVGITNGERVEVLWSDTSYVPRKHNAGGQSKERFARGREEMLKHWLRKVAGIVADNCPDRSLVIGGPGMTKDRFIKELPAYVADRIIDVKSCGYTDINGLYEILGRSWYR